MKETFHRKKSQNLLLRSFPFSKIFEKFQSDATEEAKALFGLLA